MNKIKVQNITKRYGDKVALNNISVYFEEGKIYGLLGRNGAGKSTLMNIIANRVIAQEGEISINGLAAKENPKIHPLLFCMSEADYYDKDMKVKDHFKWTARFYDQFDESKAEKIVAQFDLDLNTKFKALSKGYKSIFKISIALAMNVPYVIYDEPIQGLDANHRELFYKLLLEDYEQSGRTIIIATHLIEEVAHIIEDVVIIDKGSILVDESVEELLSQGYSVSGKVLDVDAYIKDKKVLSEEVLGSLKVAHLLDDNTNIPESLDVNSITLQKMFIYLTEKGRDSHE